MGILKKIVTATRNQKTYKIGLIQSKAYRILKYQTNKLLEPYGISSVEWAFLGLLYENSDGLRMNVVAEELGVEAPFVTQMIKQLKDFHFIKLVSDPKDNRAKCTCLTEKGKKFVDETENMLRKGMKPLLADLPVRDVLSYLTVLQKIIDNSESK